MKAEDENGVKKKTTMTTSVSEKCDENEEEQEPVHTIMDSKEQGHSKGPTPDGMGSKSRDQAVHTKADSTEQGHSKGSTPDGKGSQSRDQAVHTKTDSSGQEHSKGFTPDSKGSQSRDQAVHTKTDSTEQGHSKESTQDDKGSQTRDQAKEDTSTQQVKDTIKERSLTMNNVKCLEKESKSSLKCDKKIESTQSGTKAPITQGNRKKLINGGSHVTAEKNSKSESGRNHSNSQKEKTCDPNTQKMCKPCSDSDIDSIQSLKSKIDSAKASGKSINALLYEIDKDSEPTDNKEENKVSSIEYTQVSFSVQGDELSLKLEELTVSDGRVNNKQVSENDLKTEVISDPGEDTSYLATKGPMSHPKHTQVYEPYPRPNQTYQQIPQLVPNEGDFFEAEFQVDKFYDEDDLLKALNEIAPETNLNTSPEHFPEPVELLPCEETMPLPNPCPMGVNNPHYLIPVQGVTSPQNSRSTIQTSHQSVEFGFMPCPDPQQRSTSADTIKQTPSMSVSYEPRPNSYPSMHIKESLEDLFNDASDIIVNDLRQSNQQKSAQKTNANYPAQLSGENPMHHVKLNQPAHPFSNLPVSRSQPSQNQGMVQQDALRNQNPTRVIAAKPQNVLQSPAKAFQPKRQSPSQRASNGNLPHILQEIADKKMPVSKTSPPVQTSVMGNNYSGAQIQFQQSSQMETQFISHHSPGVHPTQPQIHPSHPQIHPAQPQLHPAQPQAHRNRQQAHPQIHPAQPQVCDYQNPVLVPRQTLKASPGGECMNGIRPRTTNSNHRGANPQHMIELTKSNPNPRPQMVRPNNNQSCTVVQGKDYSTSQNMGNSSLPHSYSPYPSAFPTMASQQMAPCVTSQPMSNGQGMTQQPVSLGTNPFIQHFPNGQNMQSHPYPFQDGLHMPMSENLNNSAQCIQGMPPQNGQCMQQPVQVIIYHSSPIDNSKPRFRKILPKPPASAESGK
ncbi:uncharacterized protein LOC134242451 [Saccostrea cucullata]|uniref:uncharacterized protein LOC134242451 n=1 Tax=Saccostrea cuccullata TaxID=36930 RepID=UPI002ED0A18C